MSRPPHPLAPPRLRLRPLVVLLAGLIGAASAVVATPAPVVAAPVVPPVLAADGGTIATTLAPPANAFPTGSGPQRLISRDCGHSVEVPGGRSLWLFCDTGIHDDITGPAPSYTSTVSFVPSGTAGLAPTETDPTPSDPVHLTEAAYPARPKAFIVSGNRYGPDHRTIPCSGGRKAFAWTQSLVTLPGTSTVLAFYQDHCPDLASGFAPYDIGVGELTLPDVAAGDVSGGSRVAVSRLYESIQVNPTPGEP
ncbi:MAG TPA: hypothetical protein VK507_19310, partial [Iamia sp.]|nr:hypothetical protein [Iamia sp.]